MKNIVLIAMPGAGKTTVGRILAESLQLKFLDIDDEFYKKYGYTTAYDIEKNGLDSFRERESEVVFEASKNEGFVIATGGGAVVKEVNRKALKENGIIVYIERDIDKLDITNRPVSKNRNLKELFEERRAIYEGFADIKIKNDTTPKDCSNKIINELKKYKTETRRSAEKMR